MCGVVLSILYSAKLVLCVVWGGAVHSLFDKVCFVCVVWSILLSERNNTWVSHVPFMNSVIPGNSEAAVLLCHLFSGGTTRMLGNMVALTPMHLH